MGYYYEPLAIVDEETYDAAMWNKYESARQSNLDEMVAEIEQEDYYRQMEEEYEQMREAMEGPSVKYADGTPYDVIEKIETINTVLNGNSHKMKQVVRVRERGCDYRNECTEVWYKDGTYWAVNYDEFGDYWDAIRLDALSKVSIENLAQVLIDEIF